MFEKPAGFNRVGLIQFFLALFFVLWLLVFPVTAIYFAWPIHPALSALFIGAGFMLRAYLGYHLWREKHWYRLRWAITGDLVFLGVLFVATWWHVDEMNWHLSGVSQGLRFFSFLIAHIWILAYTFEPLTVYLLHPRTAEVSVPLPDALSEGPVQPALRFTLLAFFYSGTMIAALLFLNPQFASTRWPWELNPFDARIMAAWPAGCAAWAWTMYRMQDWAEVKIGVRALLLFVLALFVIWVITFPGYDHARNNGLTFGVGTGLLTLALLYSYWKQEAAKRKLSDSSQGFGGIEARS